MPEVTQLIQINTLPRVDKGNVLQIYVLQILIPLVSAQDST